MQMTFLAGYSSPLWSLSVTPMTLPVSRVAVRKLDRALPSLAAAWLAWLAWLH